MRVVILCGGNGTRLSEETEYKPKPLVDIGGKPLLWHLMKSFTHFGHKDFVLCLGYKGELIKHYFLNYDAMNNDCTVRLGSTRSVQYHAKHLGEDFCVTLADTGDETLTGCRIKRVECYVSDGPFIVTYGDGVSDVDVPALIAFHRSHGKLATMTVVRPYSRYGIVEATPDGMVQSFSEKPQVDGRVNGGWFVFEPEALAYLDDTPECALEGEPLKHLARDGQLMAYEHNGFFFAMDTYREYLQLNAMWESGKAPWAVWMAKEVQERVKKQHLYQTAVPTSA